MSIDRIILSIFAIMFIVGAFDYLRGDKYGLGKKFFEGLQTFAPLMLAMAGFIVLTDLLAKILTPVISPVFTAMGADPGLFSGIILACDNGAYPLAAKLGTAPYSAGFGGMLLGALLGVNISSIPLVMQFVRKEDRPLFFKGSVCAVITIPAGLLAGGLAAGYPLTFIAWQLPPLVIISILFAVMLKYIPDILTTGLNIFAKCMEILSVAAFSAAVFAELSGTKIPGFISVLESVKIVGAIAIVLPGVYVFTELFQRIMKKPLSSGAKVLHVNESSVTGLITVLANAIPTLVMIKDMDKRGKLINGAFVTSAAYMLGDHLAFCGATAPKLLVPLLVTKFTAGTASILLALFYLKVTEKKEYAQEQ